MADSSHAKFVKDLNDAIAKMPILVKPYLPKPAEVDTIVTNMEAAVSDAAEAKVKPAILEAMALSIGVSLVLGMLITRSMFKRAQQKKLVTVTS
jgi:hypothetical protein